MAPRARKKPVTTADLRAAVGAMGDRVIDVRDRAVLLVGCAGGFRRSEVVAPDVEDLDEQPEGLAINIRRSKRDQEAEGHIVAVVYGDDPDTCPVRAMRAWLAVSAFTTGAIFRPVQVGDSS